MKRITPYLTFNGSTFTIGRDKDTDPLERYNDYNKYIILNTKNIANVQSDLVKTLCEFPEFALSQFAIVTNIGVVAFLSGELTSENYSDVILTVYDVLTTDTITDGDIIPTLLADESESLAKLNIVEDPLHYKRLCVKSKSDTTELYFKPDLEVYYNDTTYSSFNIDYIVTEFSKVSSDDASEDNEDDNENSEENATDVNTDLQSSDDDNNSNATLSEEDSESVELNFSTNELFSFELINPSEEPTFEGFYENISNVNRVAIDFKPHLLIRTSSKKLKDAVNVYFVKKASDDSEDEDFYYQLTPYMTDDEYDLYFDMTNFQLYMVSIEENTNTKWYIVIELDKLSKEIGTQEEIIEVL